MGDWGVWEGQIERERHRAKAAARNGRRASRRRKRARGKQRRRRRRVAFSRASLSQLSASRYVSSRGRIRLSLFLSYISFLYNKKSLVVLFSALIISSSSVIFFLFSFFSCRALYLCICVCYMWFLKSLPAFVADLSSIDKNSKILFDSDKKILIDRSKNYIHQT